MVSGRSRACFLGFLTVYVLCLLYFVQRNIKPRTRQQRRQLADKETLEKSRLREVRGPFPGVASHIVSHCFCVRVIDVCVVACSARVAFTSTSTTGRG